MAGNKQLYRDPEWLRARYWDEEQSMLEMADEVGCSTVTIFHWMKEHNIERRPQGTRRAIDIAERPVYQDGQWLRTKYRQDGWSLEDMASAADCSASTIWCWMEKHNIGRRHSHPFWGNNGSEEGCIICEAPLPSQRRRYCTDVCAEAGRHRRDGLREERLKGTPSDTGCSYCGQPLSVLQEKRGYRFCTVQCWAMSKATLKGTVRTCMICGKEFEPYYKGQLCCDKSCGNVRGRRTEKERGYEQEQIACGRCGKNFSAPKYTGAVTWTMCPRCRREWDRDRTRRRRVLTDDLAVEEVMDHVVFQRDGWTCQLCGEPVDPECKWPDSLSPSIDHIVPLSRGGEHSMDNVQLAHLGCNCRKNNNVESCDEGQKAEAELAEKA